MVHKDPSGVNATPLSLALSLFILTFVATSAHGQVAGFRSTETGISLVASRINSEKPLLKLVPHEVCTLTRVDVPDLIRVNCSNIIGVDGCPSEDCGFCTQIALKLDCDSCWVEDITFSFDPADECFAVCGLVALPTQPYWYVRPSRDRVCEKTPVTLSSPNQYSVTGLIKAQQSSRSAGALTTSRSTTRHPFGA